MAVIVKVKTKSGIHYYSDLSVNGKRHRRYLGLSLKVATMALQELEYELRFGNKDDDTPPVTYSQAIMKFLTHVELTGTSYGQVKYISSRLHVFKAFCHKRGHKTLNDITKDDCRQYIADRSKQRIKNFYNLESKQSWKFPAKSTLNREIGFQRRFVQFCIDNDYLDRNAWVSIPKFKDTTANKPRYSFSEKELKMIFKEAGVFHDFYFLLNSIGLRPTDAFVLHASAFDGNTLTLQQRKTSEWLMRIPIPKHVVALLSKRIQRGGLIFPELQSDRQRRNARRCLQSLFEPSYVREHNIRLHVFRHTYAMNMLNRLVPKSVLQTLLGHKSIRTTELYANWVSGDELSKWVE
jgi:site-specific recombinase XerD